MPPPLLDGVIAKTISESALRRILIVPFALQIVGTVGLVGYLSFRNGQQAIDDLVSQLMVQVSDRVDQHLDNHLAIPHQINQVNLDAFELGLLDLQDFQSAGRYFWKQMKVFDVGYINFANANGEFIGVERLDDNSLVINETLGKADNLLQVYTTDSQGNRIDVEITDDDADVREEAWYADAVQAGKPIWSQIYPWQDKPEILSLSSSYPIYNPDKTLIGVIGVDLILSQISGFLSHLHISPSSRIFILERDGRLVATASHGQPLTVANQESQRLQASESPDRLIQLTSRHLEHYFNGFSEIRRAQKLTFRHKGELQFVRITPWQDDFGLDWIVVVAVPERDFMAQIHANTRTTIVLCLAALVISLWVGRGTARWVTNPILRLNQAAKEIAAGNLAQTVDIQRRDELGELAESFNRMAIQLQTSFSELRSLNQTLSDNEKGLASDNQTLEQEVQKRTQELTQTLDRLKNTHAELTQAEKMAALGHLVAGIAHEINTPLGAIQASISNISSALNTSMKQLPQLFQLLKPEQLPIFFTLLEITQKTKESLSFREERQLKRILRQALEDKGIPHEAILADYLTRMGVFPADLDRLTPLLETANSDFILETAAHLSVVQNNSQNIMLAIGQAVKMVSALKSYARQNISDEKTHALITDGLDTVLTLYHNQLSQHIRVIKHYDVEPSILCYPEELTQVWSNLISNAIHAMKDQGRLTISVSEREHHVVVKITDSGKGIPLAIQDKLFEPFFTTKPPGEGTGLGLDIVLKIVNKHRGKIDVESIPGHTTFRVWLPIE
ncbi:MAG: ATP-binding protein [Leptolyngbyaceae cyanobacterium MO_188.B28]|nr:ATP-binding protein [Leptolyngbyaceae cyanobacterium MO_188.B28]